MLFDERLAPAILDPHNPTAQTMGFANLHPRDWFFAFDTAFITNHLPPAAGPAAAAGAVAAAAGPAGPAAAGGAPQQQHNRHSGRVFSSRQEAMGAAVWAQLRKGQGRQQQRRVGQVGSLQMPWGVGAGCSCPAAGGATSATPAGILASLASRQPQLLLSRWFGRQGKNDHPVSVPCVVLYRAWAGQN